MQRRAFLVRTGGLMISVSGLGAVRAARPAIDRLTGIPPTVAIEQRVTRGSRKSTVATITEVAQYLRLLYARLGIQHHPDTDQPVKPLSPGASSAAQPSQAKPNLGGVWAPLEPQKLLKTEAGEVPPLTPGITNHCACHTTALPSPHMMSTQPVRRRHAS